jgi:hypothetical protein
LGKPDFFFDFGDKGPLGVVEVMGLLLGDFLRTCLIFVIYVPEGTAIS